MGSGFRASRRARDDDYGGSDIRRYRSWIAGPVALLLAFAAQVPDACTGPSVNEQSAADSREEQTVPERARLDELLGNPDAFYGDTVRVSGEASEVLTPLAFEIGGERDELVDPDRNRRDPDGLLVVLGGARAPEEFAVGRTVEVTGTFREFDLEEVEQRIDEDLAGGVFTKRESAPSIIASSVEVKGEETSR